MDIPSRLLPLFVCVALVGSATHAAAALPAIDNNCTISGGSEDTAKSISYADLVTASNAADSDPGDTIMFRVASISGTLKKGVAVVAVGGTLSSGETWDWTPPTDANGTLNAFSVTAVAGGQDSNNDCQVKVSVAALNDAPSFTKGGDITVLEDSSAFTQNSWATNISEGPSDENSQSVSFVVTAVPDLFSTDPAVNASGRLTFTPALNANGTSTVTIKAVDNGASGGGNVNESPVQTFTITITAVNDKPTFAAGDVTVAEDSGAHTGTGWVTSFTPGPADESGQTATYEVTNTTNGTLFSVAPAVSANGTLTFTPAPDENGSSTITVRVTDSGDTSNGGIRVSDTQNFTITVTPVNDPPVLGGAILGTSANPLTDVQVSEADPVYNIFGAMTIIDVDDAKPTNESLTVTVTVANTSSTYGTFALPGSSVVTSGPNKIYTLTGLRPAAAQSALRAATYTIPSNAVAVGDYQFTAKVEVRDSSTPTPLAATPVESPVHVRSVNDPPEVSAYLTISQMPDSGEASPFRMSVTDPDLGDTFSVTLVEVASPARGSLVFPGGSPITGNGAAVASAIQGVIYRPSPQSSTQVANFRIGVTDIHPGGAAEASAVNPPDMPLTIVFVNSLPDISGVTTELQRITTDPSIAPIHPFSTVTISDLNPGQDVTVTLSILEVGAGSFSSPGPFTGTAAAVTAELRALTFSPTAGRLPLNETEIVTVTITVSDGGGSRSNDGTRIEVTSVNGAPRVEWDPSGLNSAGVFPLPSNPALISPLPDALPFSRVEIVADGQLVVTVSLDTAAKGGLQNLGGFVETAAGSRIYQFAGTAAQAEAAIQAIKFVPSPAYQFPPNQPGRTDFTITASDSIGNLTTRLLPIILRNDSRTFLVTNILDGVADVGSLRHAVSLAQDNDVITFALPSYPAVIRLKKTNGPLVVSKHLTFRGPGADKLTISGDSNANDTTDANDVQLFQVSATVRMKGFRMARGYAATGGAISVYRPFGNPQAGSLTVEDCVFANCKATQWGGALDVVEGSLAVDRCVFENNSLIASSGQGGGAVSLFTNKACSVINSTFSGNSQPNPSGFGGGAIYAENFTSQLLFKTQVSHCTFAGNINAPAKGSSVYSNVANTQVKLTNNIFSDYSARNLYVEGSGEIRSSGGNFSNDNTSSNLIVNGNPGQTELLNHDEDHTNSAPLLASFGPVEGQTRGFRLLPGCDAIGAGVAGSSPVDQRGVIRNGTVDSGALDADALGKLIIHEIFASQTSPDPQFIEFFNPRDQAAVDVGGYEVHIDGIKRHVFAPKVIAPGFGIILADTLLTPANSKTDVVIPSIPSLVTPVNSNLDLAQRGKIEIKVPSPTGAKVIESVSYVAVFVDSDSPATSLDFDLDSITLAPQFQGAAFVPHSKVKPDGGVDLAYSGGDKTSPGADAGKTPFGEDNAYPIAVIDRIDITEDDLALLDVLANDLDADGSDELFIVDLNQGLSVPVPATGNASLVTLATGDVGITPAGTPLRGTAVTFDPREAFNSLPGGARVTDTFAYSIIDVGGGAVTGYTDGGATSTVVSAASHRMKVNDFIVIRDAAVTAYNGSHQITAVDDDTFTIGVAFGGNPAAPDRGRWQSVNPRTPSARGQALVQVTILGRNDPPAPLADTEGTDEETVLRIFADPDLATTGMSFDTDSLYPQPRKFGDVGLLENDDDPDTNDQPFTQLHVIGVCQASAITGFSGAAGASPLTVTSPGHGLQTGASILISGYGGHPSYNGNHVVTVDPADSDKFTIPVVYQDNDSEKGVWTVLNDDNRFSTTSAQGAPITLEIRANRIQTNVVYNPRGVPSLNALADGESVTDTFYYAVEDTSGAVSLALVSVEVDGVNDAPVPTNDPGGLAVLNGLIPGGMTLADFLGGSAVLHVQPSTTSPGGIDTAIRPPGGGFNDVVTITGLDQTDEDTSLDMLSADLLANDSDVDTTDPKSIEIGAGQTLSREGAEIRISPDGLVVTYDPTAADNLQALAFKERVIDTFTVTVFDGIARVDSLVAVLVEGLNDQPVASAVALTIPETDLLEVKPPGLLLSGLEIDQNTHLPDNRKFLLPTQDFATTVFGAKVNVLLENRSGDIDSFAQAGAATSVTSPGHGLRTGEEVVILGGSSLTGQYLATVIDDDTFTVPVTFDAAFAGIGGATWKVLASTFQYDPRESVFSDEPGGPVYTLQGLAADQTYLDTYTYTLLDGSFLFANDDIFRVEANRTAIELRVLANDTNLEGLATSRRVVEVGPTSAGGTLSINAGESLVYTPPTGFVGDEVFSYTIEDDLGNRDTATVTARVTVDRLNGNLRANADSFTVARGQAPLLNVLANDSIIPATGNPLELVPVFTDPDQGGQVAIENGFIRYTPDATATVFPYTETFGYRISGGGTVTADATVTVLVLDRTNKLNVRADDFSVPAGSTANALNVLANDNILPGDGGALVISSTTVSLHGVVITVVDNVLVYTPPTGFLGNDSFSYTASDGFGGTGTALVNVHVGYLTTNSDFFSVRFDDPTKADDNGATELDVLANDNVLQGGGGLLTITGVVPKDPLLPAIGVMSFAGGQFLSFDPDEGATGQREFIYTVSDGGGRSTTGSVTVVVIASGVRASSDAFTVQTDSQANELPVLTNDLRIPALADALSIASIGTGPDGPDQGGTVEISADSKRIIYTAAPGFRGVESFTYTVTDGDSSDTARVSVRSTIGALVAGNDEYFAFRGSSLNRLEVLSNDRVIPDAGQVLFITAIGMDSGNPGNPPNRGLLEVIENGAALRYTPSPDNNIYPFEETFTYEISSGGTSRDEAVVRIKVLDRVGTRNLETNDDVFSVRSDSIATVLPVLANDSVLPASADGWVITGFTPPTSNVCSPFLLADFPDPAALAAYLADHDDALSQFLWARFDPASQTLLANPTTSELQLRITLVAVMNEVVESGASVYEATRFAGVTLRGQTQSLLVQGVTGEQLIVLNRLLLEDAFPTWINPAVGGGTVQFTGTNISYIPQPGFVGAERFTYRVSDGLGGTGFAEVIVRVGDISVSNDVFTVVAGAGAVDLDVTANDGILRTAFPTPQNPAQADFTLSPERSIAVEPTAAGIATVNGDVVSFTPAAAFVGRATLTYWVHDDSGCEFPGKAYVDVHAPGEDRDSAVVSITVTGVNDLPKLLNADPIPTNDKTSVHPFANATVIEYDDQRQQPVRITLSYPVGHGILTGSFTEISPGVIELYGTAADVTVAMRALVFTPFMNRITVGTTEDTLFSVSMDDDFVTSPVLVNSAVTEVTPVDDPPVIAGTLANQKVYQYQLPFIRPFAGVNITDVDDLTLQSQTVSVQIDNTIKGNLTNLNGFVQTPAGSGLYVRSGTPAEVSAALRGLVFEPTPGNRVTPTSPELVGFTISVDDAFLPAVVDGVTSVLVMHAQVDRLLPLDGTGQDVSQASAAFGTSVAVSGDTMAVGSPLRDAPAADAGRVYIYERNAGFGAPWGRVAEITGSDTIGGDRFGRSIAIDGDMMVVGASQADPGGTNVGAAYVFQRNPADPNAWLQVAKLVPPVKSSGDAFGTAVAIHGNTILVGAPNANLSGAPLSGRVFAFENGGGGPGDWTNAQTLIALDNRTTSFPGEGEYFGYSLAFDGNTAVIGAYGANRGSTTDMWDYGAAYVFTRSAPGQAWTQTKRLDEFTLPDGRAYDGFGYSVAISGDQVAVGVHSPNSPSEANNHGRVHVYERNLTGANQWGLARNILPVDGPHSDHFGSSVALSNDMLMIGSPGATQFVNENRGFVVVYRREAGASPTWQLLDRFSPGATTATDRFGSAVAFDGFFGVVGAIGDGVNALSAANAGSARVYQFQHDLGPRLTLEVPDQLAQEGNAFEFTVDPATFDDPVYPNGLVMNVQLTNGDPLPAAGWLSFDPLTGRFSGTPAGWNQGSYDLVLVATNPLGSKLVSNIFQISVGFGSAIDLQTAYDAWSATRFVVGDLANPALEADVWGMFANPDGDPYGNLLEMLFGTDPETSDPNQVVFARLSATQVSLTFPMSLDFPVGSVHIEWSTDMVQWSRNSVAMTQVPAAPGLATVTAVVTTPAPEPKIFVRIAVGP